MDSMAYKGRVPEMPTREPPPSYSSICVPTGLDQLSTLSRVDICKRIISTEAGDMVFKLKRDRVKSTLFHDLYDSAGKMVMRIKPNYGLRSHMKVHIDGQYVSKLQWSTSCFDCSSTTKYVVTDPAGGKILQITSPPIHETPFLARLHDLQGNDIGTVTRKWHGCYIEQADSYELQIEFPRDLGVQYKAAVIGFCFECIHTASLPRHS